MSDKIYYVNFARAALAHPQRRFSLSPAVAPPASSAPRPPAVRAATRPRHSRPCSSTRRPVDPGQRPSSGSPTPTKATQFSQVALPGICFEHRPTEACGFVGIERTAEVLDNIPVGEPFNWVEQVSIELTTRMLATLFDYPFEQRHKLTFWSDMITTNPLLIGITEEKRMEHLIDCLQNSGFTR